VPRDPFRSLVESGRREPGDRPRVQDRAEEERPGAQVHLQGHDRREGRRPDRVEARARVFGRRRRRRGAPDRARERRAAAARRARHPRGAGGGLRVAYYEYEDDEGWGGYPRYVPVAERREKARKEAARRAKRGQKLSPVKVTARSIATTFW